MKRFQKPTAPLGWLYVVNHPNAPSQVKIGITERPESRMKELGNTAILARVPVMKPREKEQLLHNRFAPQRVPQTEYFQLDDQQLEFVLNACNSWMGEVRKLIVEPHIPESVQLDQSTVKAQPMHGFPEPGESMREFIERPAKQRRSALELRKRQMTEANAEGEAYRKWMVQNDIPNPLSKKERQERERKEYQAWLKRVEESL